MMIQHRPRRYLQIPRTSIISTTRAITRRKPIWPEEIMAWLLILGIVLLITGAAMTSYAAAWWHIHS